MRSRIILLVLFGLGIILIGCSQNLNNGDMAQESSRTQTTFPVNKDAPPTTQETNGEAVEEKLSVIDFLVGNGSCSFPCYWGITPGESTIQDAADILDQLEDSVFYENKNENGFHLEYENGVENSDLRITTHLYGEGTQISLINVGLFGADFNLAEYYLLENLIKREGVPTGIWISVGIQDDSFIPDETSYDLLLFYEETNSVAVFLGTAIRKESQYLVCPEMPSQFNTQQPKSYGSAIFFFGSGDEYYDPNTLIAPTSWETGEISQNEGEYFSPIQYHTAETEETFSEGILQPGLDYCFAWHLATN